MSSPSPQIERYGWVLGADGEHGGIDRRDDGTFMKIDQYTQIATEKDREIAALVGALERIAADNGIGHDPECEDGPCNHPAEFARAALAQHKGEAR